MKNYNNQLTKANTIHLILIQRLTHCLIYLNNKSRNKWKNKFVFRLHSKWNNLNLNINNKWISF